MAKPSLVASAAALLLLVIAGKELAVSASTITFFESACTGKTEMIFDCNVCHNITLKGGYFFAYTSNNFAFLYNAPGCAGTNSLLNQNTLQCSTIPYVSAEIFCTGAGKDVIQKVVAAE